MRVERLVVNQFRNLRQQEIGFSSGVNLFVGANGQGKTNILEAIDFFKFGRSFRTHRDTDLVQFDKDFMRAEVTCRFNDGDTESFAASVETDGSKKIKISGKDVVRLTELLGRYPCILFGPHDLKIVYGAPSDRRRFLDMVGSMTAPSYITAANNYRRILAQRNAALKSRASDYEIHIWNQQIVGAGAALIEKRDELVRALESELKRHALDLGSPFDFSMRYDSALLQEKNRVAAGMDSQSLRGLDEIFATRLAAVEHEERRRLTTMVGPHRDDVTLNIGPKQLRKYGSQGQQRLFAILLKLAELSYVEQTVGEPCVLLLDDVFSEFDRDIMKKLQHLLDGTRQVFITSPIELDWVNPESVRVYHVKEGRVNA